MPVRLVHRPERARADLTPHQDLLPRDLPVVEGLSDAALVEFLVAGLVGGAGARPGAPVDGGGRTVRGVGVGEFGRR